MNYDDGQYYQDMDWYNYLDEDSADEDDELCECGNYKFLDLEYCALCCQGINCSRCGEDLIEDTLICETCSFDPETQAIKRAKRYAILPLHVEIPNFLLEDDINTPKQTMACA